MHFPLRKLFAGAFPGKTVVSSAKTVVRNKNGTQRHQNDYECVDKTRFLTVMERSSDILLAHLIVRSGNERNTGKPVSVLELTGYNITRELKWTSPTINKGPVRITVPLDVVSMPMTDYVLIEKLRAEKIEIEVAQNGMVAYNIVSKDNVHGAEEYGEDTFLYSFDGELIRENPPHMSAADFPNRELRPIVREAIRNGWVLTKGGKHFKLTSPAGAIVFLSGTGVGSRGVMNVRSELRRAGLDV